MECNADHYLAVNERANTLSKCQPNTSSSAGGGKPQDSDSRRANARFSGFSNLEIRRKFVAKVYAIVGVQLLVTSVICLGVMETPSVKEFFQKYSTAIFLVTGIPSMYIMCALMCCCSRAYPCNIFLLALFTIFESILVSCIIVFVKLDTILIALGITTAIVIAVSIFSAFTSVDITKCWWIAILMSIAIAIFGIVCLFVPGRRMEMVYCSLGALSCILYLAIDTQMIVGGGRQLELSPEDYVVGALMIYTDIITLLLYIIQLIESSK